MSTSRYVQLRRTSVRGLLNWLKTERDTQFDCNSTSEGIVPDAAVRRELNDIQLPNFYLNVEAAHNGGRQHVDAELEARAEKIAINQQERPQR